MDEISVWIYFNLFLLLMLAIDLGLFNKKNQAVSLKQSLFWSCLWISLALVFNYLLYRFLGQQKALEFFTGYVIEKSLSVDNIFVIILIFQYFSIPDHMQHRVLFWGVMGALVMRFMFIFLGVELVEHLHWVIYVFGLILVYTGVKMVFRNEEKQDLGESFLIKGMKKIIPLSPTIESGNFFTRINGKRYATPLFFCLIVVEVSDLIFAVDSIPAILTVTNDKFIIYSSNAFAILGLRALYFAVAGLVKFFAYLHYALAFILTFVGIKMLLADYFTIPTFISLLIILSSLGISILCSLLLKKEVVEKQEVMEA